ncbi:MAG: YciI family protein [Flavisolibacter sp.]
MFVIELTYKAPMEEIDRLLPEHNAFLDQQYAKGIFLASGRKVPREGGIILATGKKLDVEAAITSDPFYRHDLANYRITEFQVTRKAEELKTIFD